MLDLFGNDTVVSNQPVSQKGRRNRTSTHPKERASELRGKEGDTCGTCIHAYYKGGTVKRYYKCAIAQRAATGSSGTDIRLKDPSCVRWEKRAE